MNEAYDLIKLAKSLVAEAGPSEDDLIDFLIENPNPKDSKVHAWAEKNGWETDDVEALFYGLATRLAKILRGGKSKGKDTKVDPKELKMGIEIEHEHVDDAELAEKIARDHLMELPKYYSLLKEMEEENE